MVLTPLFRLAGGLLRPSIGRMGFTALQTPTAPAHSRAFSSTPTFHQANHSPERPENSIARPHSSISTDSSSTKVACMPTAPKYELRPDQEVVVQKCLAAFASGLKRIAVSSPTGSGKTVTFIHLIKRMTAAKKSGKRGKTFILVGASELVKQTERTAKEILGPGWSIEVEQATRVASGQADVTIGTYQTLKSLPRLRKFDPGEFELFIIDEGHHAAAETYRRAAKHSNSDVEYEDDPTSGTTTKHKHRVKIVGFSATFSRPDQLALSTVFEEIVHHRQIITMVKEGLLSPIRSIAAVCDLGLQHVSVTKRGDYSPGQLSRHLNSPAARKVVVDAYHDLTTEARTLVFAVNIEHVNALKRDFQADNRGRTIASITSDTPSHLREEIMRKFLAGETQVLVNCEILLEGADLPRVDCIIHARPTKSQNLFAQMVGRGARLSPGTGKKDCLLIDIVDKHSRRQGIAVMPTLSGRSPTDPSLPWRDPLSVSSQADLWQHSTPPETIAVTYEDEGDRHLADQATLLDMADPLRLLDEQGQADVSMSANAWVYCDEGYFVLGLQGDGFLSYGYVTISPNTDKRQGSVAAWIIRSYPNGRPMPPRKQRVAYQHAMRLPRPQSQFAYARTLERAFFKGDKFAKDVMGVDGVLCLQRIAEWRKAAPRYGSDLEAVLRSTGKSKPVIVNGVSKRDLLGRVLPVEKITAGHVAACLCVLNHTKRKTG